jgi:ABC-type multidrug transport system ATPase subunit
VLKKMMPPDAEKSVKEVTVEVALAYRATRDWVDKLSDKVEKTLPDSLQLGFKSSTQERRHPLRDVNFVARPGQITGIIGSDSIEVKALIDLLARQRKYGIVSGDVTLTSGNGPLGGSYIDHVAHVPREVLYTKGLTFLETAEYAARLHLVGSAAGKRDKGREQAVISADHALEEVGAARRLHTPLDESADGQRRGDMGGDLRRLDIATEMVRKPSVLVLDGVGDELEGAVAASLFADLKVLARKGHTIICSLSRPPAAVFEQLDSVVLLMEGRSIFSGPAPNLSRFFIDTLKYNVPTLDNAVANDGVDKVGMVEFLLGIANMTERPHGSKVPLRAHELQQSFIQSDFYDTAMEDNGPLSHGQGQQKHQSSNYRASVREPKLTESLVDRDSESPNRRMCAYNPQDSKAAFFSDNLDYWAHKPKNRSTIGTTVQRAQIILLRAFQEKFRDVESLQRQFGSCVLSSTLIGYFLWSQGDDYGGYCLNMVNLPYAQVSNFIASFFFITAFSLVSQVLNVHAMVAKINAFKRQRRNGQIPPLVFGVTTLFVELCTAIPANLCFSAIYYNMSLVRRGATDFSFMMILLIINVILGQVLMLSLASVIGKEIPVRDIFLALTFLMLFMSGYPFQLPTMRDYMASMTEMVPMRWMFEGLMIWKWESDCGDGMALLEQYGFANSKDHKYYILNYMVYFCIAPTFVFIVSLFPMPGRLMVRTLDQDGRPAYSIGSMGSEVDRPSYDEGLGKKPLLQAPVVFSRTGSMTSEVSLCMTMSTTGNEVQTTGCTVTFKDLEYAVPDETSPLGTRTVLHKGSGSFTWGRLSVIMGASGSGKSSLLFALAGAIRDPLHLKGSIQHNGRPISSRVPFWHRCGFVEANDYFLRDLSVEDTIYYAMQMRRVSTLHDNMADENVKRVMNMFELSGEVVRKKKAKALTPGECRRLTIACAIVHGPGLVMIDEPFTALDIKSVAIIMNALRDLVNQDKTVICSVHEPSFALYELFDSLMLLSYGRIIYHGRSAHALQHFRLSKFLADDTASAVSKERTTEYLLQLSAARAKCKDGTFASSLQLEEYMNASVTTKRNSMTKVRNGALGGGVGGGMQSSSQMNKTKSPLHMDNNMDSNDISLNSERDNRDFLPVGKAEDGVDDEFDTYVQEDMALTTHKLVNLLKRSWQYTFGRHKLVYGSCIAHVILAVFMGWILGDTEGNAYNTTSFFTIGVLLLILLNIQQVFWIRSVYEVYEGEVTQGLYSPLAFWAVTSLPMYLLRVVNSIIFVTTSYSMLELKGMREGYCLLQIVFAALAGLTLTEAVCYYVDNVRAVYLTIPVISMVLFFFSGLPVKPSTLPFWIRPWGPSISVIRWAAQSLCINEFEDDYSGTMNVIDTGLFIVDPYERYLGMFGWGGKSKWDCFVNVFINIIVFRAGALLVLWLKPMLTSEKRHLFHENRQAVETKQSVRVANNDFIMARPIISY